MRREKRERGEQKWQTVKSRNRVETEWVEWVIVGDSEGL